MRLNRRHHGGSLEMNMTPMIDVVFLLMIYFMTTLSASTITKEPLELPPLQGSQDQHDTGLTINISQSGQIVVAGEELSVQQLVALASDEIATMGSDPSRLNVIVRADRRGTSRVVNEVVSALVKLDVSRIHIGVQEASP